MDACVSPQDVPSLIFIQYVMTLRYPNHQLGAYTKSMVINLPLPIWTTA